MEIRDAQPGDVEQILPMVRKLAALHESWDPAKFGYLPHPDEMYRSWLTTRTRDKRSVFLVADREPSQVVGFIVGTVEREIPIYRLKEFGYIHDLWVDEPYRNEGIARQLVMAAVETFSDLGLRQVRCETATANEAARHLFSRCGFHPSVTEMLLEILPVKKA